MGRLGVKQDRVFGSPNRPLSPQVPQRMAAAQGVPEDSGGGGGSPGVWGAWGPWSACSRSCSGGVMEQTRPCLPSSYRARGALRPGAPPRAFAGHVVSAVRTSVPLHRSRERQELRAPVGPDASRQGPESRGSRHPQARARDPTAERRYTRPPATSPARVIAPVHRPAPSRRSRALSPSLPAGNARQLLPAGEEFLAQRISFHLLMCFAAL